MRYFINHNWVFLILLLANSSAFAHFDGQHSMDIRDGLIHLIFEPSHLSIGLFVIFLLVFVLRNQVIKLTDRFINSN